VVQSLLGRDWRKFEAHLLLLSKFLHATTTEKVACYWTDALQETPHQAIKRFLEEGLLVSAGLSSHLAYMYRVSALQTMLKQRGLPVSGCKDALICRLIEADPEGMKKAVAGLTLLQCSERGQKIANQYLASEEEKREATEWQAEALAVAVPKAKAVALAVAIEAAGKAVLTEEQAHALAEALEAAGEALNSEEQTQALLDALAFITGDLSHVLKWWADEDLITEEKWWADEDVVREEEAAALAVNIEGGALDTVAWLAGEKGRLL
jgi:hypothetical protein